MLHDIGIRIGDASFAYIEMLNADTRVNVIKKNILKKFTFQRYFKIFQVSKKKNN